MEYGTREKRAIRIGYKDPIVENITKYRTREKRAI